MTPRLPLTPDRLLMVLALIFMVTSPTVSKADEHHDELAIGQKTYMDLHVKGEIAEQSPYTAILLRVGARISRAAEPHWFTERFYILRDNAINAFSAPGGYVFVNVGLLRAADNVDELAAVLGHETAHLVLGHVVARQHQARGLNLFTRVGALVAKEFGSAREQTLVSNAQGVGGGYSFLNFTRQQEYAADQLGAQLAARAGYNPWGSVWFFEDVEQLIGDAGYEQYVQEHPSTRDRIARLRSYISANPQQFGRWRDRMPSSTGLPMSTPLH